ncbi:uncharacterized protein FOBCDRAFT_242260 [Fusarium oxysporum Fo47]|uniref:uncharacterized protein n=1 Tax=Fusarium oxysporum Fo47 TaxID=660027 RepID=UPI002869ADC3|nr:uncharacterized protein FOBCDRAFT_242260 [Fusarium oxysporum Fo47]QKD57920.2 hypothetical protein FOBCDRAFT_242260 [Fusarium oxysporum Fo47]
MSSPQVNSEISAAQYPAFIQHLLNYPTFAAPIIPYFFKPYQYVSPNALDRIDKRFPVVKKPTEELYRDTRALILLLYHKGLEGKDHVFQDYSSEANKNEQAGLVAHGKAAATTVLVKAETTNTVNEKINQ